MAQREEMDFISHSLKQKMSGIKCGLEFFGIHKHRCFNNEEATKGHKTKRPRTDLNTKAAEQNLKH